MSHMKLISLIATKLRKISRQKAKLDRIPNTMMVNLQHWTYRNCRSFFWMPRRGLRLTQTRNRNVPRINWFLCVCAWIMHECDEHNFDSTMKPHDQKRDSYNHAQKMRASMTYAFGCHVHDEPPSPQGIFSHYLWLLKSHLIKSDNERDDEESYTKGDARRRMESGAVAAPDHAAAIDYIECAEPAEDGTVNRGISSVTDPIMIASPAVPVVSTHVKREPDASDASQVVDLTIKSEPVTTSLLDRTRSQLEGSQEVIELLSDSDDDDVPSASAAGGMTDSMQYHHRMAVRTAVLSTGRRKD
ncbi:hypothetical protein B0H14DRAFT_3695163 [Mycena olivaceomarginata]|nr:hypothetical protein B0H14DRAFT_3695163 [Mycena olivaceomarginata]